MLAAAGAEAALGLIPGLKLGNKARKALGKADDVADAAGDVGKAAGNVGRGGTKLRPDSSAQGPHSTFKRDPQTGKVTNYETYQPQTNPRNPKPWESVKRYDGNHPHFDKKTGT